MANYAAQFVPANPLFDQADSYSALSLTVTPTITYAQRVWSTGGGVWCYYIGAINATPASTATTPNWVGSAIRHELLGPV
jgi:hypothetical protein